MPRMTNLQIEHAQLRLRSIVDKILGPRPSKPKGYDIKDFMKAIEEKPVALGAKTLIAVINLAKQHSSGYYNRQDQFSDALVKVYFGKAIKIQEMTYERECKAYDARAERVAAESTKVEDAIILGESSEALRLLEDLAKLKV